MPHIDVIETGLSNPFTATQSGTNDINVRLTFSRPCRISLFTFKKPSASGLEVNLCQGKDSAPLLLIEGIEGVVRGPMLKDAALPDVGHGALEIKTTGSIDGKKTIYISVDPRKTKR